jgi:hypothetical protein
MGLGSSALARREARRGIAVSVLTAMEDLGQVAVE